MSDLAIVILNYNGKKHLAQFLPSVIQHSPEGSIYVVDNGSTDESLFMLRADFPQINIIQLESNSGFAGGYNNGLQKINSEYLVLLNSDVEVTPGWLDRPLALLKQSDVGACQPKILSYTNKSNFEHAGASGGYLDKYGFPFCRGRIFDFAETDQAQYNTSQEVFWATGACMFVKRSVFFEAGGFDSDYFAHMEEIDLCWRMKILGYKIYVEPASVVYHLGGGTLQYNNPIKTRLNFRNNLFTLQKNLSSHVFITVWWRMCIDSVAGLKFLFSGNFSHFIAIIKGHWQFIFKLFHTRRKRKEFWKKVKAKPSYPLSGWYPNSIVLDYFLRKKKKFSQLNH